MEINVHDALPRLSELLDLAEAGEEVVVTRNGKRAVRPVAGRRARRFSSSTTT